MADVFVSYAHANRKRVVKICEGLKQGGFDVWWDERLEPGEVYQHVIEKEIETAKSTVVAWSAEARNSLWVLAEANRALDENKLTQVRLDGARPPLPFNALQILDLSSWRGGRSDTPFPEVEAAARAAAGGQRQPLDPKVFTAPPLQNLESAAVWGWASIGIIYLQALLIFLAAPRGPLDPETYRSITLAAFGASCLAFLVTLLRVIGAAFASRVRS